MHISYDHVIDYLPNEYSLDHVECPPSKVLISTLL